MSVNPNKNKMNTIGMKRYVLNILPPPLLDKMSVPYQIKLECEIRWEYYTLNSGFPH